MRGGVRLVQPTGTCCSALLLLFLLLQHGATAKRCDRSPEGHLAPKSDPEGKFTLRFSGSPGSYEPGEIYTVSLQGSRQFQVPQKFTGFMLNVEPEGSESADSSEVEIARRNVGTFQLFGDALTKFSEQCPNTVTQTSSIAKSDIQVLWNAPPPGSGCLVFRAVVVEHRDIWYMDDGPLSLTVCEDIHENLDEQPEVMDKCCACDEAKYEVTFEGLWSRHSHPKDFPSNGWLTRFSDLIGATHTSEYRFWEYGGVASEGLRQVAERGSTRMLESELKAESEHIRTIIKARGISYPNVTGKTFAVFRVDRKHHLMSLVSMIDPSPDWIVGVSGLELCLRNCSWVEFKVLNLYPWDAGTDSGITYISADSPTTPRGSIKQITAKWPKDEDGPFYDPMGEDMKPFARLYLTRQRLYEKSCSDDTITTDEDDSSQQSDCLVGDWSDWTPCSVSCGKGIKHRQRFYLNPMRAEMMLCRRQLTSRATCYGRQRTCSYYDYKHGEDGSEAILDDPLCAVSVWSKWSTCSATCGPSAVRTRSRKYLHKMGRKRCGHLPNAPPLEQTDECQLDECEGEETSVGLSGEEVDDKCRMTEWSDWGPCSVTCGLGTKMRTRLKSASEEVVMSGAQEYPEDDGEQCAHVENMQQVQCEGEFPTCDVLQEQAKEMCRQPKDEGRCKGKVERWYFDTNLEACQPFEYSGCRGNRNNFVTKEDCERRCNIIVDPSESPQTTLNGHNLRPGPYGQFESGSQVLDQNPDIFTRMPVESYTSSYDATNCEVTRWSRWSACSVTCGKGVKQRSRSIMVHPQNGGRACPKKLLKFKKCKQRNCDGAEPGDGEDGGQVGVGGGGASSKESNETAATWGGAGPEHAQCVLSEWTPWSQCSTSCGHNAFMQRTRYVIHAPPGVHCGHRIETRPCNLLPCKF